MNANFQASTTSNKNNAREDGAMLRAAADLTRDLSTARPAIYWLDMLISAVVGYGALVSAVVIDNTALNITCGMVSISALYRAASFIHELTHINKRALPGFRTAWNLIVGIPLLIPSFLYEEVHTQHHGRTRYGTAGDPEYLPLALMTPWSLLLFVLMGFLAPIGLILRFGVLAPLSMISRRIRRRLVAEFSALSINPTYRRREPEGEFKRMWLRQEAGTSIFAIALIFSPCVLGFKPLLVYLAIHSGVAVINQLRTLVAHLWENEGEVMSVTEQYLDSVNVPPPSVLAAIWAPVGLRYHALHHLVPSVPYHSLGTAHRRLVAALESSSSYHHSNHPGMWPLVRKIVRSKRTKPQYRL